MSRVTQSMLSRSSLSNLQQSLDRTGRLQERLATGRQINRPSDSPTGTVTALQTRSSMARAQTHLRGADNAKGWLDTADSSLQSASSMLLRARDLTVQGANSSVGAVGRENIAKEIESLRDGLLELANTRYGDRFLFAGTQDVDKAFTPGTYTFEGDDKAVTRTVADGVKLQINLPGSTVFGEGADSVFQALDDVADDLRNNPGQVSDRLVDLDGARDKILTGLGTIGATSNRLESLVQRATDQELNLRTRLSGVEDVDLPETIMELQMQEVAYQAALSATSRVIQPSLLDFLR